ncbi:hypothetical protein PAPHI01_1150 [Pancytospora philotis]|nr:hypothetical protein PAPHI01_1150 [Pancytospora philotis]
MTQAMGKEGTMHLSAPTKSFAFLLGTSIAIIAAPILTYYLFCAIACSMQVSHYRENAGRDIPIWAGYGVKAAAYHLSTIAFKNTQRIATQLATSAVLEVCIIVGLAAYMDFFKVNDTLAMLGQVALVLYIGHSHLIPTILTYMLSANILHTFIVLASLALLWRFVGTKIGLLPSLMYALFISNAIYDGCCYYLGKMTVQDVVGEFRSSGEIELSAYKDIDAADRAKILGFCESLGLRRNEVFVVDSFVVNAAACSGPRFQFFFFTAGILKLMPVEKLLAVAGHEIGHIKHNHVFKGVTFMLVAYTAILTALIFAHYKLRARYGALLLMLGGIYMWEGLGGWLAKINNAGLGHGFEYQADAAALKTAYGRHMRDALLLLEAGHLGILFDYKNPAGALRTHPSALSRVQKCEQFFK